MSLDRLPSQGYKPTRMGRTIKRPKDGPEPQPPVGERIKAARTKAGFTQAQAAGRMVQRVTAAYWSDIENGRRKPSLEWLWEAAKALGVNPSKFDDRLASKRWPKPQGDEGGD